jgi:hypothetical protein
MRTLKAIKDTLDDINRTDMWEPQNTKTAEAILKILEPLLVSVIELSHQNFNLLQAKGVLEKSGINNKKRNKNLSYCKICYLVPKKNL